MRDFQLYKMANHTSDGLPIPIFFSEHDDHWFVKMKTIFRSQYLWKYVENGYREPKNEEGLTNQELKALKEHRKKDAKALSHIQ